MRPDCEECRLLWSDYGAAITAHIRLQSKLQLASLEHNPEKIASLQQKVEAAENTRADSREAIRRHERSAHPDARGTIA
jgi:hypothetical protein